MDIRTRIAMINLILVGFAMLMGAPALAGDAKAVPTVSLTQAVHFTDVKGQAIVIGPGEYQVELAGKSGLKLTPVDGKTPIVIEGHAGPVKVPVALSVPVNENEHHLVLLLPEGKAIDVVGSPSGVTSREGLRLLITAQMGKAQLMDEEAGDLGNPPPPPPPPPPPKRSNTRKQQVPFVPKQPSGAR